MPQLSVRINKKRWTNDEAVLSVERTADVMKLSSRLVISVKNPVSFGKGVEIWCIASNASTGGKWTKKSEILQLNQGNYGKTVKTSQFKSVVFKQKL